MTPRAAERRAEHEAVHGAGPRVSRRRPPGARGLRARATPKRRFILESDEKSLYGPLGRALFGGPLRVRRHSLGPARPANRLPINHTNARLPTSGRACAGDLVRLQEARRAEAHLQMRAVVQLLRGITNRTRTTPARPSASSGGRPPRATPRLAPGLGTLSPP